MSIYWKYINNNDLHAAIMKYFTQTRTDPMTEVEIYQIREYINTWILSYNIVLNIEDYPISEEGLDTLINDCLSHDLDPF